MTENNKKDPTKTSPAAEKPAETVKPKAMEDQLVKTAKEIFEKIKAKTHIDSNKVEAFQKSWLTMPATRKKYEHLADAPQVAIEEVLGMTNDIIDHIQGQATPDQSQIFKALKDKLHTPMAAVKGATAVQTPAKEAAKPVADTPKLEKKPKAKATKTKAAPKKKK